MEESTGMEDISPEEHKDFLIAIAVASLSSKSQLLWDPLFTPDLSTFLIGIIKLKLS
jgi:hypothetical protein